MIKGIFFDLDGTLIQSMFSHYIGWKKVLINHGVKISKNEFYLKEGTKLEDLLEFFFKNNKKKFDKNLIRKLIKQKNDYFIKNNKIKFYPGVKNLMK